MVYIKTATDVIVDLPLKSILTIMNDMFFK